MADTHRSLCHCYSKFVLQLAACSSTKRGNCLRGYVWCKSQQLSLLLAIISRYPEDRDTWRKIHFAPFFLGSIPAALLCHLDANKPVQSKLLNDSTLSCTSHCKLSLGDSEWFNQSSWDHAIICFPFTNIWFVFSEGSESLHTPHCDMLFYLLACTDMKCPFFCVEWFQRYF